MKKILILTGLLAGFSGMAYSQSAISGYGITQPDMKGTARFMGMAGAFGALGGDLSAISQNPAGIGVYRSSDIGFTLDLDVQNSNSEVEGRKYGMNQTKFLLNNIGAVLTLRLPSKTVPNLNFGFTYNKSASFNRVFGGNIPTLHNSMSNYIAGVANAYGVTEGDVFYQDGIDPYNPGYGYFEAPWITIMGAQTGVITSDYNSYDDRTTWYGLWENSMNGRDTNGSGSFLMRESGGLNDFNIVIGGNIADKLYWGMNFDIINLNYKLNSYWGEALNNAYTIDREGYPTVEDASWDYSSVYTISGTGFNYQLGLIFKPVQALRFGFAFHTPTWYSLNEEFMGSMNYTSASQAYSTVSNYGTPGYNSYNFRTPWKIIASAAGVIGNNFIVSFDYEWANYGKMHYSERTYYDDGYYGDYWYDPWDPWMYSTKSGGMSYEDFESSKDPYYFENQTISTYYKSSNTFRVGLEFKPISSLSIRLGYANVSSPVKKEVKDNGIEIFTPSLTPSYRFDNSTNYITCGLGYRYQHIYVDLAYVYKQMSSEYHAYTPDTGANPLLSPQSKISFTNNQIVLSAGYRF